MHRHDGRSLWCDCCFDLGRVKIQGLWIDVHKDGFYAIPQQRMRRGYKRIRRSNDLASDAQGLQGGYQCDGAIGKERQVLHTQVFAQRLLKLLVKWPTVCEDLIGPNVL